jgi:hypothetical protein
MKSVTIPEQVKHYSDQGDEYPTAERALVGDIANAVAEAWKGGPFPEVLVKACKAYLDAHTDAAIIRRATKGECTGCSTPIPSCHTFCGSCDPL